MRNSQDFMARQRSVGKPEVAEILVIVRSANGEPLLAGEKFQSELLCGVKFRLKFESVPIGTADLSTAKRSDRIRPVIDAVAEAHYADDGNPLCDDNR